MKAPFLVCCVVALAFPAVVCTPDNSGPTISVTQESLAILVTEVEGGIMIENLIDIDCIVYVRSPEGEQVLELDVGDSVTVTDLTEPITVWAVSL